MFISPSYSSSCFAGVQPSQNKEYRYNLLKVFKIFLSRSAIIFKVNFVMQVQDIGQNSCFSIEKP